MILYGYDNNFVYTGPRAANLNTARPKNADGSWNYLRPARSTDVEPPTAGENESAVWSVSGKAWSLVKDYRGKAVYSTTDGTASLVTSLGEIPAGFTTTPRPDSAYAWSGSEWVVDLSAYKAKACDTVDATAEAKRLLVVTAGEGQMTQYQRKYAQAVACLADTDATAEKYPALAAEVGVTAETLIGVATVVKENGDKWLAYGDAVETVRLSAKKAVNAAEYTVVIDGILSALSWPTVPGE